MRLQGANLVWATGLLLATLLSARSVAADPPAQPAAAAPANDGKPTALAGSNSKIDVSKPYGYHLQPILDKIKATADQRQKISQVVQSYKSTIQPLRDQYKVRQQEFISLMVSGGAAESIMAKQVELGHLSSEITSKYCLMKLEIRHWLTPQQILQYESYGREHGWNH